VGVLEELTPGGRKVRVGRLAPRFHLGDEALLGACLGSAPTRVRFDQIPRHQQVRSDLGLDHCPIDLDPPNRRHLPIEHAITGRLEQPFGPRLPVGGDPIARPASLPRSGLHSAATPSPAEDNGKKDQKSQKDQQRIDTRQPRVHSVL